jgi:long-chain acyl-CoA synthetase
MVTALADRGVGPGDRVLLMLRNRAEFHVADLASLFLRATPVSVYNSSAPEQLEYLAGHSGAKVAILDDAAFTARLLEVRDRLPDLAHVVVVDADGLPVGADVTPWAALAQAEPADLHALHTLQQRDDLVTVIYTSGTTGNPKGVMIDHANVAWEVAGYASLVREMRDQLEGLTDLPPAVLPIVGEYPVGMRNLSYLPMAHIAERMVTHYSWLFLRSTVTCCPDQVRLGEFLVATHPHVVFGPPRVWEKLRGGILAAVASAGPEREAGFALALQVGQQVDELRREGPEVPAELAAQHEFFGPLAYQPLRERVGLDAAVIAFSGAAPLPKEVAQFFRALGVPFSEVYGMSENTGGMTWSPFAAVPGTVGQPWPGAEVRLGDDGEVLCRGGIVARGYLDDPDRTAETFDAEGWLHTGDIGEFDANGDLRIVDRKKELIITAGGKNISPANIEARLKMIPLVGQAAVVGDNRPYLVAILVLDPDAAPVWAAAQGFDATDLTALAADQRVVAAVQSAVDEVNESFSRVEQIKKFVLVGEEWAPDSEQLTATMKLKRRGVTRAYGDAIEGMYAAT